MRLVLAAGCIAVQLCSAGLAQPWVPSLGASESTVDAEKNPAATLDDAFPVQSVRIEAIELTQEPEVPSAFILPLLVTNGSREPVELWDISVRFLVSPGTFKEVEPTTNQPDIDSTLSLLQSEHLRARCDFAQGQIEPRSTRIAHCAFEPIVALDSVLGLLHLAFHWRTLTLSPAKYQLLAVAHFRTTGDPPQVHYARSILALPLRPTIWQIVMGAGFGALLLALFLGSSDYQDAEARKASQVSGKTMRKGVFVSWAVGWLAASIVIFMTHRMRDAGFPIAITVNDFYGGIVLGLFGFLFSRTLRERFVAKQADVVPPTPPVPGPPPSPAPPTAPDPNLTSDPVPDPALGLAPEDRRPA